MPGSFLTHNRVIKTIADSNELQYDEVVSLAPLGFDNFIKTFHMEFTDQVIILMNDALTCYQNLQVDNEGYSWLAPFSKCDPILKLAEISLATDNLAYQVEGMHISNIESLLPNWRARLSNEMRKTRGHALPLLIYNTGLKYEQESKQLPENLLSIELASDMLPFYVCQAWGGLFLNKEYSSSYTSWKYLYNTFQSLY